jgi:hypothetical protein
MLLLLVFLFDAQRQRCFQWASRNSPIFAASLRPAIIYMHYFILVSSMSESRSYMFLNLGISQSEYALA